MTDDGKSVSVGQAGHITSAAPGGPRYEPALTAAQRKAPDNGIWLCSACHTIVDADASPFSAELLREWKAAAESRARQALELAQRRDKEPAFLTVLHRSMELIPARSLERSMPPLFRHVHEVLADIRTPFAEPNDVDIQAAVVAQLRARDELWACIEANPSAELAYYGVAHVPLAIHLGHLLGTRVSVHFAERERDAPGWRWLQETPRRFPALAVKRPEIPNGTAEVAVAISTSYPITREQVIASVGAMPLVTLAVPKPAVDIVRSKSQVELYSRRFREELEVIARVQTVRRVHLFAATPMSLSFAIGRQIRRTVHPDVLAYNYHKAEDPPYSWRLLMTDDPMEAEKLALPAR